MNTERKIPGGKLVRIRYELEGETITSIRITGDYFLHPEQTIDTIEKALIGTRVDEVATRIRSVLETHDATLIGCSPEDVESMIREDQEP